MRAASAELTADIADECTTLARLLVITRADGTVLRFTDHDRPIPYLGDVYRSDIAFEASAIFTSSVLSNAQSVTIRSLLAVGGITEDDVRQRRYDGARGDISVINWASPEHGIIRYYRGIVGQAKLSDKGVCEIELTPAGVALDDQAIGSEVYQVSCRNSFGDSKCTKDLEALKVPFTVVTVVGSIIAAVEFTQGDEYFTLGYVRWITGANAGTTGPVLRSTNGDVGEVTLVSVPLLPIEVGDTGEAIPGCDKLPKTCRDRWANFPFFRGEPNVPVQSLLPMEPVSNVEGGGRGMASL